MNKVRNKLLRVAAVIAMASVVSSIAAISATAADPTYSGTTPLDETVSVMGNITPTNISVTCPVSTSYSIDSNAGTFTAPDIAVTNNGASPISVTINSLTATENGSIQFTDVLPTGLPGGKTWSTLSAADSKKYIALGIHIENGAGWNSGYNTATDYAASGTPITFGTLSSAATGNMKLIANFGHAFDGAYTASHDIVFEFSVA